ncbi:dihydroorotate dehydrogenase [Actibacterium sp. D379-3]
MADTQDTERELERFFAAARQAAPMPSEALMARVAADAAAQMQVASAAAPRRDRPGLLAGLMRQIGGWPALAGLATATVAGVWIGYAAPGEVGPLTAGLWPGEDAGYDVVDLIPSMDGFLTEGGA